VKARILKFDRCMCSPLIWRHLDRYLRNRQN